MIHNMIQDRELGYNMIHVLITICGFPFELSQNFARPNLKPKMMALMPL